MNEFSKNKRNKRKDTLTINILFVFFPIINNVLPRQVGSQSIQGRELGLLAGEQKASMFEADYVARFGFPFLPRIGCAHSPNESHPIGQLALPFIWIQILY